MTTSRSYSTVIFVQPDGMNQEVQVRSGTSLMEAALRSDVRGIEAKCRGSCACVTCHVHIDPKWLPVIGPAGPMEESMLDFAEGVDSGSRLACQVLVNAACDGIRVAIPRTQRTLGF